MCDQEFASDAVLLRHLGRHSFDSNDLFKLIQFIHKYYEGRSTKRGYTPWDMRKNKPPPAWWEEARIMRRSGMTLQAIGDYFHVTRERVRQVLNVLERM